MSRTKKFYLLLKSTFFEKNQTPRTIQEIRAAMLHELGEKSADNFPRIHLRVSYAEDIQDLWHLRNDVMTAISAMDGEAVARSKLSEISQMFRGLIPNAYLVPRTHPKGN